MADTGAAVIVLSAEADNRTRLAAWLTEAGIAHELLAEPEVLWRRLAETPLAPPGLLVLDGHPAEAAYPLVNRLQGEPTGAELPVLLLADNLADGSRRFYGELVQGIEVLPKPLRADDFLAQVRACLALDAGRRAIEAGMAGADWGQTLREGLLAIDGDGRIRYANHQAARWLRLSPLALCRLHLLSLLEPPVVGVCADWAGTPLAGALASGTVLDIQQLRLWRQEGGSLAAQAALVPLRQGPFAALFAFRPRDTDAPLQEAARLARIDLLTGLPSRPALEEAIRSLLGGAQRPSLLLLDIDHLRHINETLGHGLGDQLLQAAAARLRAAREPGFLAALGGGRFAFLQDDAADYRAAGRLAQRLQAQFRPAFLLAGHEVFCTVSIGIALYPASGHDPVSLLQGAELALDRAKALGRNLIQFDSAELNRFSIERLEREAALHQALAGDGLQLVLRPWQDGAGQVGAWQPWPQWPGDNDVQGLAEECGLAGALGDWLLAALAARAPLPLAAGQRLVLPAWLLRLHEPEAVPRLLGWCRQQQLPLSALLLMVRWREDEAARLPALLAGLAAAGALPALYLDGRGAALGGFVRAPWQALVLGRELLAGLDRTDVPARQAVGMLAALHALGQSQGWPVYAETLPRRADLEPPLLAGLVAWRPDPRDHRKA